MPLSNFIAGQFAKPTGIAGRVVTSVMNGQNRPMYHETAQRLSLSGSNNILDIGCGNGYMLNMLASQHNGTFSGIDISESILRAASRRNRSFIRAGQMSFTLAHAAELPFDDAAFDRAYTVNTVYFWEDLDKTMAEIRRVLRPQGIFVNALYTNDTLSGLSHTQHGYKRFTSEQLIESAHNSGFEASIEEILYGKAYCVVCRAM